MSDILHTALECIRRRANSHLQSIDLAPDERIILCKPREPDTGAIDETSDKLVMAIHGFAHETSMGTGAPVRSATGPEAAYAILPPSLYLDVRLAIVANFRGKAYPNGLAVLSRLISFFQATPMFSQANTPDLDPRIEGLVLEVETLTIAETDHVMRMLGIPYLPTAFYRMRALPFTSESDREIAHARGLAQPVPID